MRPPPSCNFWRLSSNSNSSSNSKQQEQQQVAEAAVSKTTFSSWMGRAISTMMRHAGPQLSLPQEQFVWSAVCYETPWSGKSLGALITLVALASFPLSKWSKTHSLDYTRLEPLRLQFRLQENTKKNQTLVFSITFFNHSIT